MGLHAGRCPSVKCLHYRDGLLYKPLEMAPRTLKTYEIPLRSDQGEIRLIRFQNAEVYSETIRCTTSRMFLNDLVKKRTCHENLPTEKFLLKALEENIKNTKKASQARTHSPSTKFHLLNPPREQMNGPPAVAKPQSRWQRLKPLKCLTSSFNTPTRDNLDDYIAMSYFWGSKDNLQTILVDDEPFKVTVNLHQALLQLRTMEQFHCPNGLKIWTDAICINQDDSDINLEKDHQVGLMGKIYESASNVLVWLGHEDDQQSSNKAINLLESLAVHYRLDYISLFDDDSDITRVYKHRQSASALLKDHLQQLKDQYRGGNNLLSLDEILLLSTFFDRQYWRRLWILQELVCARSDSPVLCGSRLTHWRYIRDACILLSEVVGAARLQNQIATAMEARGIPSIDLDVYSTIDHIASIGRIEVHRHRKPFLPFRKGEELLSPNAICSDVPPSPIPFSAAAESSSVSSPLMQALKLSQQTEASKPLDRVYGMLSLPGFVPHGLEPNYEINHMELYTSFAALCMMSSLTDFRFEPLAFVDGNGIDFRRSDGSGRCSAEGRFSEKEIADTMVIPPSWAPDLNAPPRRRTVPIEGPFDAGGDFDPERRPRIIGKELLICSGFVIDTVDGLGAIQSHKMRTTICGEGFKAGVVQPEGAFFTEEEDEVVMALARTLVAGAGINYGMDGMGWSTERDIGWCLELLVSFLDELKPPETSMAWMAWDFIESSAELMVAGRKLREWFPRERTARRDNDNNNDEKKPQLDGLSRKSLSTVFSRLGLEEEAGTAAESERHPLRDRAMLGRQVMQAKIKGRRLATTRVLGRPALVPISVQSGDYIAVLQGHGKPVVIRPDGEVHGRKLRGQVLQEAYARRVRAKIMGECYVDGCMSWESSMRLLNEGKVVYCGAFEFF